MRNGIDALPLRTLSAMALLVLVVGCNRPSDTAGGGEDSTAQQGVQALPAGNGQVLDIAFASDPNPVRAGNNALTITVKKPDGVVIDDATVSAQFYMPAMPSMNMPEMRSEFIFSPKGQGRYEATGQLVMGGTWNVTVTVQPADGSAEARQFSVIAN